MPTNPPKGDPEQWRCDTCSIRHTRSPISWTYYTRQEADTSTLERLKEKMNEMPWGTIGLERVDPLPGEKASIVFQDPEWGVCQPCHELIQDGDLQGLIQRNYEQQFANMMVFGDREGVLKEAIQKAISDMVNVLTAFWAFKEPNPVREEYA